MTALDWHDTRDRRKVQHMTENLVTARQIAALAGCTPRTVVRYVRTGELPVAVDLGLGLPMLFTREDAEAFAHKWKASQKR